MGEPIASAVPQELTAEQVLADLCLDDFEPALRRMGVGSAPQLAEVRYEELLEIGLSKVQCHLFLAKVSSLVAAGRSCGRQGGECDAAAASHAGGCGRVPAESCSQSGDDVPRITEVEDAALAEELAAAHAAQAGRDGTVDDDLLLSGALGAVARQRSQARRAALRQLMPPPLFDETARSSRKRAHSSHLSTGAARGSELVSTAGSASGSSSSSLHQDVCVKKRRVVERLGGTPPFGPAAASLAGLAGLGGGAFGPPLTELPASSEHAPSAHLSDRDLDAMLLQESCWESMEGGGTDVAADPGRGAATSQAASES
eukprot:TRINITY_DN7717_c0_g3_i1.p2 TRINITY_DN7717_c0_g3~~TRINITY_DN7717_c0_g3_i1.p2  ORF type:complete len:315 (+),score=80.18 TRINITY_DN7717_c0_g3_i1:58-1002(+)